MRIIGMLIFIAAVHTPAFAQDAPGPKYGGRDGSGALLFRVSRLSLHPFGGGIGGKYWLSDTWAMNANARLRQYRHDADDGRGAVRDYVYTTVGLTGALERHLLQARFSPYVGMGMSYSYTHSKSSRTTSLRSSEYRSDGHNVSIAFNLGAEFWLSRSFSLAGQYTLNARYMTHSGSATSSAFDPSESSTDAWTTIVYAGSLILGVYF